MTDITEQPEFVIPTHLPPSDAWRADRDGRRVVLRAQYAIVDGFRPLELDLVAPGVAGPHPVVLWIHGGAWRGGTNRDTAGPVPSAAIREGLLAEGIAVASVQYRLTAEAPFPAQLHDVIAAVRWLRHYAAELELDSARVGAWGESAGGHLAALLGVNIDDAALLGDQGVGEGRTDVQAAVPWYPPTDLLVLGSDALIPGVPMDHDAVDSPESQLVGGPVQERPDAARAASPITYASATSAPMLLVHGAEDVVVSPRQSERLAVALRAAGAEVEVVLIPGANHVLTGVDPMPSVERSIAFLVARLQG